MKNIIILLIAVTAFSCGQKKSDVTPEVHAAEVEQWHEKRVENLKGPQGWLNVAGLFWLKEGMNTFGSAETNDVIFPKGKIVEHAGYFTLKNGTVTMNVDPSWEFVTGGVRLDALQIYQPSQVAPEAPVDNGSLQWFVIVRDGKYGIRLRDFESEGLSNFHGIERYPVDPAWRVEARLEKAAEGKTIDITNILGQTTPNKSPGALVFEIDGEEFRLDAIDKGGPDLFVIFGDPTNEKETYPSGRYIYVSPPDEKGMTIIDFNKAYNPPCAFTPYATCPLPPRQNILKKSILAGEKNYHLPSKPEENL